MNIYYNITHVLGFCDTYHTDDSQDGYSSGWVQEIENKFHAVLLMQLESASHPTEITKGSKTQSSIKHCYVNKTHLFGNLVLCSWTMIFLSCLVAELESGGGFPLEYTSMRAFAFLYVGYCDRNCCRIWFNCWIYSVKKKSMNKYEFRW